MNERVTLPRELVSRVVIAANRVDRGCTEPLAVEDARESGAIRIRTCEACPACRLRLAIMALAQAAEPEDTQ